MKDLNARTRLFPIASWVAWVLAVGALTAAVVLQQLNPPVSTTEAPEGFWVTTLWMSAWVGFGAVGALIVSRRPDNRIGWILSGITFGVAISLFATSYARYGLVTAPGSLPLASVAAWIGAWSFIPTVTLVLYLLLTYPSGRPAAGTGRWLGRGLLLVGGTETLVYALRPGPIEGDTPPVNPLGVAELGPVLDPATGVLGMALAVLGLLTVVHAVVRFRRSSGVERQQFRWFLYTIAAFPVLFQAAILLEDLVIGADRFDPVAPLFAVMGNGLAVAIYVAISRHGLYEIDRVVNRTVVYSVVTAMLVATYAALVFILQPVLRPLAGGSDLAVAASTLAVAATFGPLRRRVQSVVDRRFNRVRYDATQTVASFGQRLRDEVDLSALDLELNRTVLRTVGPRFASLLLTAPETRS